MACSIAFATSAQAKTVGYLSQHPVPHKFGGGFCYIDVPHVHNYPPGDARMYRENDGQLYFVGDPAPFGYDGPRFSYYGAHPVVDAEVRFGHPIYCYIKGPHYHWYQPPAHTHFELSGGAYWYVGNFPPSYYAERPRYAVINEAYAPMPYARPVVDVQVAPAVVRAEISIGGPGWRASAVVGGPSPAPVHVPPPPPPPSPAVQIGVGINLGGPAALPVMIEQREYVKERRNHGRHRGWYEPPRFRAHDRRRPPPARFSPVRAPVTRPLLRRAPPQHVGPGPHITPTPRPAPAPRRGPAPVGRHPDRGLLEEDRTMKRIQPHVALVLLLAVSAACRKDKAAESSSSAAQAAHVKGTPSTDEVLAAWRNQGLAPEGFDRVEPAPNSAAFCKHGKVHGVDTLVCEYASEAAITRGMQQVKEGWERVDVHTGVLLRAKRTTMVVVDRERREPSGKTISQMANIFSKL